MNFNLIREAFFQNERVSAYRQITGGNINKSYLVTLENGNEFLLQKINKVVFTNPECVMKNAVLISDFLKEKGKNALEYVKAKDGKSFFTDDEKEYWRVMKYFNDTISYSFADDDLKAYKTGEAYGRFYGDLKDFDIKLLNYTIRDFHNKESRYQSLLDSFNTTDRKETDLFDCLRKMTEEVLKDRNLVNSIPKRVTHNDTKIDNLLFDKKTGECVAVVDMDTVMPGYVIDDFGDAARSVASTASENERDESKISFDLNKFAGFTEGFAKETKHMLTATETGALYYGVASVTAELACRFLSDYFNHDVYFGINYPEHNLVRAANQIALLKDVLLKQGEIKGIINKKFG